MAYIKHKLAYGHAEDHSCSSGLCSHEQQQFVMMTSSRILSIWHGCQSSVLMPLTNAWACTGWNTILPTAAQAEPNEYLQLLCTATSTFIAHLLPGPSWSLINWVCEPETAEGYRLMPAYSLAYTRRASVVLMGRVGLWEAATGIVLPPWPSALLPTTNTSLKLEHGDSCWYALSTGQPKLYPP